MPKLRKHRTKKPTKCPCLKGWACEDHPKNLGIIEVVGLRASLCRNPNCRKDPDSIFLSVDCEVQPGRRKPAVREISFNV
jgi:hypothetical protein